MSAEDAGLCQWFALCTNRATLTMPWVIGRVPICERCAARPELAARRADAVPINSDDESRA